VTVDDVDERALPGQERQPVGRERLGDAVGGDVDRVSAGA